MKDTISFMDGPDKGAVPPDQIIAYTLPQAAKVMNISKSTVYRLINDGELTPRKVRGRTLLLRADILAYFQAPATLN